MISIDDKILLNMAINNIEAGIRHKKIIVKDRQEAKQIIKETYNLYKSIHKEVFE
jgi:hypothetical protein